MPRPAELLPHGSSLVFLDAIEHVDADEIRCRVVVRTGLPRQHGPIASSIALEYIAQAAAALAGLRAGQRSRAEVGLVVAVRDLRLDVAELTIGTTLRVFARWEAGRPGMGSVVGRVEEEGRAIASARLTIARGEESA